ncbi:hypothetical protein D3C72_1379400 [compost metagenome]
MMIKPVDSPFNLGLKVTFVVAVNSSAGNFCNTKFGALKMFEVLVLQNRLRYPKLVGNPKLICLFACHCH